MVLAVSMICTSEMMQLGIIKEGVTLRREGGRDGWREREEREREGRN